MTFAFYALALSLLALAFGLILQPDFYQSGASCCSASVFSKYWYGCNGYFSW